MRKEFYIKRLQFVKIAIASWLNVQETTPSEMNEKKRKLAVLSLIYKRLKKKCSVRSMWVRPAFSMQQRMLQGDTNNLLVLLREDRSMFFNYLRMNVETFEALYSLIGPSIEKQSVIREPISSTTRLQITIRYLATGDCMKSIGYAFRCAHNTVCGIIHETCQVIWHILQDVVLKKPGKEKWLQIARDYEKMWNFPHCIGAIDGKHIAIQVPANSGSKFYNYKKNFSFNLTGVADAHCRFILIDVGAAGRCSDAGVFDNSSIKKGLETNSLDIPEPCAIGESRNLLPYTLVGDEAYPLNSYLMRPYPRSSVLDIRKKVFNYRLSRARRVIENSFGILVARWHIFRKTINTTVTRAKMVVLATICLHNFIITKELQERQQTRQYGNGNSPVSDEPSTGMRDLSRIKNLTERKIGHVYLEKLADYFMSDGAVHWQWEKANQNDF